MKSQKRLDPSSKIYLTFEKSTKYFIEDKSWFIKKINTHITYSGYFFNV